MLSMTRFFAVLSVSVFALSGSAQAATCGDTLLADTVLTAPLNCSGPGLIVGADDILIDCNNHTITGSGFHIGIQLVGRSGVTVRNCHVTEFAVGFILGDASGNYLLENSSSYSTSASGGWRIAGNSNGNVFDSNRSHDGAGNGFLIQQGSGNLFKNNASFSNASSGIYLENAPGNTFISTYIAKNIGAGITLLGPDSNGNIFNENVLLANGSEGISEASGYNHMSFNKVYDNGAYGITDVTGITGTYLLNSCSGNTLGPSNPLGLCL